MISHIIPRLDVYYAVRQLLDRHTPTGIADLCWQTGSDIPSVLRVLREMEQHGEVKNIRPRGNRGEGWVLAVQHG